MFKHLLKNDFLLLARNKIISISIVVTLLYMAAFWGLKSIISTEKIILLVIFNDPALIGFLFVGVMYLFEKNENTISALRVSPISFHYYIWSKSISLTIISIICCWAIVYFGYEGPINWITYIIGVIISTLMFAFIGFIVVAKEKSFNTYILKALGIILFLSLPFLSYFELINKWVFIVLPTHSLIELLNHSFHFQDNQASFIIHLSISLIWLIISYLIAYKLINNEK